jgi:hypothetical protein
MRSLIGNNLRIGLLVILVVAVFAPTLVHAKDYTLGVKAGDWVKYGQFVVNWGGNATEPSDLQEIKLDWVRMDVLSVTGTAASLNFTIQYSNGTQLSENFEDDVQTSNLVGTSYIIASNLTAGDPLNPQTQDVIDQTVTGMYAGANRNVNVLDYKGNNTVAQVNYPYEYRTYWDQNTGVMVELYTNQTFVGISGGYEEISFKATETNLWSANPLDFIQNDLIYIIAGIAVIIAIVAATIVLRRRKTPTSQQPLPPPPSTPPPPPS